MMNRQMLIKVFGIVVLLAFHNAATCAPSLTRMRAVHFTGNYGANISGIRTAAAGVLDSALPIAASSVQTSVVHGSFVDSSGATVSNDLAIVHLSGVTLGQGTFGTAAFWVGRNPDRSAFIQFRPSLEPLLNDIPGFLGDITLSVAADGSTVDTSALSLATGTAHDYVVAVLANAASLVHAGAFSLLPPATFDQASVEQLLGAVRQTLLAQASEYWDFLKAENVDWIGISVGIFNEPISNPTVSVRYRPAGSADFNLYTFDDADLRNFIGKAKKLGFKVYLTLAFEAACCIDIPPVLTDPACNTDKYLVNRGFFGSPRIDKSDPLQACMNAAYWWWDPAHPQHAANVAQFWSSYTQIAVKYAAMCQELGVDMYSIGTETDRLFRTRPSPSWANDYKSELSQMVSSVRAAYSGLVTYDQIYSAIQYPVAFDGGAGTNSVFMDLGLDVVGVSAYFVLSQQPVTRLLSVSELEQSWDTVFQSYLVPLQARNPGKPIVFLEFGYPDDLNSPNNIFTNSGAPEPGGITDGMRQQQNIYQAFYNIDDRYNNLVKGAFLWANGVFSSTDCTKVGANLHCKPLAATVASAYGRWARLYQGLWWNANESGWGMSITQHGGNAFNALYTYDAAGQPTWFVMSNCTISDTGCSGTVYKVAGGAPPTAPWNGGGIAVSPAGSATLTFASDANSGTFNFTINGIASSKSISRQVFSNGAAPAVDYTDLWWNPNESGWGMSLTQESGIIFAAWYTYASNGQATWYVASNCPVIGAGCSSDLYEVTGGSPVTSVWHPTTIVTKAGTLNLTFSDGDHGLMSYTINGVNGSRAITRQAF